MNAHIRELLKTRLLATKARMEADAAEADAVDALMEAVQTSGEVMPDGVHIISVSGTFFIVRFSDNGLVWIDDPKPGVIAI